MAKQDANALTKRQSLFVDEYLKDKNSVQAAIRAGFSEKSARSSAYRLMQLPQVAAKISAATGRLRERVGVDAEFVVTELRKVAEQEDVAQSTKVRALELLAKHLGMLEDRISLKTDGLSSEQRAERVAILLERVRSRE